MEQKKVSSPPWYTYHHKLVAMFSRDKDVRVRDLAELGEGRYETLILVNEIRKAQALKTLLKQPEMGNITFHITILGPDENGGIPGSPHYQEWELFENALTGNDCFVGIDKDTLGYFSMKYCIFKKDVIQFWNDNLADYKGNISCLMESIAREIFNSEEIQFCTESR